MASRFSRPPWRFGSHCPAVAAVVEVEHRGHGVDPQAVDVELLAPVEGVGDEEVAHLGAAEVEDERAPVGVLALPGVGVLVERGAVEAGEGEVVLREVGRHPVDEHADAALVEVVDEAAEPVGVAVAGGRGVVARDLVAPRAAEGVLHRREQLDVGEAEVGDVVGEAGGEVVPARASGRGRRATGPRSRGGTRTPTGAATPTCRARPAVAATRRRCHWWELVEHDRRRGRRLLAPAGERVGLEPEVAVGADHLELVAGPVADGGHEQLPDARRAERPHRVAAAVPAVPVADHPDGPGRRRPHGEGGAGHALVHHRPGAERLPQPAVVALGEEVEVELAERRPEAVGILERGGGRAVGAGAGEAVAVVAGGGGGLEQAGRVQRRRPRCPRRRRRWRPGPRCARRRRGGRARRGGWRGCPPRRPAARQAGCDGPRPDPTTRRSRAWHSALPV